MTSGSSVRRPNQPPSHLGVATSVRLLPLCLPFRSTTRQNIQYLPNRLLTIGEFRQGQLVLYLIAIAATLSLLDDVTGVGQIGDDGVGMSLRYAKIGRDVAQAYFRIVGDTQQSPTVVGEEAPIGHVKQDIRFL
jgi:hypothetical protein